MEASGTGLHRLQTNYRSILDVTHTKRSQYTCERVKICDHINQIHTENNDVMQNRLEAEVKGRTHSAFLHLLYKNLRFTLVMG